MSTTPTPPTPPKTTPTPPPTPPTSSPTGATTATASTSPCFNGGTWQGGQCLCPHNFQGDRCQNAKDAVEVENANVSATVEMTTKIDANFSEELNDKSSEEYRNFTGEFRRMMSQVYRDIEGYSDVEVRKLSNGSIVVDYDVLLVVSASAVANETVKNISESLVTAVQNYTGTNCSLCFVTNSTKVQNVTVQEVEEDVCHSQIQENFRDFYVPYLTAAGVVCITRCDARHADRWPCGYGSCSVGERGPRCQCSDEAAFWYRDRFCRSRVSKVAVTAGASVAALVLVTAVFTTLLLLNRRRQKERDRNRMRSRSELYDSDDGDWDRPQGFAMHNLAATWEDMETPGTSYINLERVDTSRTIHFRRPTAVP
ncbi:mucin-3B-like [Oenanthe melanoleuca]|uniref:mucin-3B-like n=1 Tax=Oenanthe melanoleuca TaxID=2939378 RepID=UPI0024C1330F|nr:mucin-3B-like [Oenanthe melanoleuca]